MSIMTVSIPLDVETMEEISELVKVSSDEDQVDYSSLLSLDELTEDCVKGFCILGYDDDSDKLVGVLSAIDRIATLDFEWSALVLPKIRRQGLGTLLVKELERSLALRGARDDLALVAEGAEAGQQLLNKKGYVHDFSEITMVANAEATEVSSTVEIARYTAEEAELIEVFISAFGDTEEEVRELIAFNTGTPNRRLMVAKVDNTVIGTVSVVDDSDKLWVTGLAVHEKARGRGIATSLLNWSKNEAHHLGKLNVFLDVETDNAAALSIYKKAGFQICNHTNFYRKG